MGKTIEFKQRCFKCGSVVRIEVEQEKGEKMIKPKEYVCKTFDREGKECGGCGHKGVFGEAPKPPVPISVAPDARLEEVPVQDGAGNVCLVVDGKRVPFTWGRILKLRKKIAKDTAMHDNLMVAWEKEQEVLKAGNKQ